MDSTTRTDVQVLDGPWRDAALAPAERAEALIAAMTLDEKLAQLVGIWVGADASGGGVAPNQSEMTSGALSWADATANGLGQLTRPFGTAPVDPAAGAASLAASQREIVARSRFGIPALVHEECLTGFAAWQATIYPAPPAWGATFDPALVEEMAHQIGTTMRSVGVHQGLAPVLDVTRDPRWGRTEETIGEDPYLVGTLAAAYVKGLESTGLVATLKHFAGYSASRGARNLAPVSMGSREFADVILPPFEMGLREGGARSVMHSYADVDGLPAAADKRLLTDLLREEWGFDGTVVADYFGVKFLETLHAVAADAAEAAHLALAAGVDVELPTVDAFGAPLREAILAGDVPEALVDRALRRVLVQKIDLGLLDADWTPEANGLPELDGPEGRAIARRVAEQSVTLLKNDAGVLPLAAGARVALIGPLADDPFGVLGCYTFPAHVGAQHPDVDLGVTITTVSGELARRRDVTYVRGCDVTGEDTSGFAAAALAAAEADVAVIAVGDRAGLFGRGTSGEGCDAADLRLPGVQQDLIEAIIATGTPVVIVLMTGRPYGLGERVLDGAAAVVQAFFAGQEGAAAIADVLTGEVNPSGRLPLSVPVDAGAQPTTYLAPPLGRRTGVSNLDPTAAFPFGHGLGYTTFEWSDARAVTGADWAVGGETEVEITVRNTGERVGADVVQLYLHDRAAQITRPVKRLIGYHRVELAPGEATTVRFTAHADLTSFTGIAGTRIVEPGTVDLFLGRSSADDEHVLTFDLVGAERTVGHDRHLLCASTEVR